VEQALAIATGSMEVVNDVIKVKFAFAYDLRSPVLFSVYYITPSNVDLKAAQDVFAYPLTETLQSTEANELLEDNFSEVVAVRLWHWQRSRLSELFLCLYGALLSWCRVECCCGIRQR
jgi:hypothetical protein